METIENNTKLFTSEEVEQIQNELNDKYLRLLAEFDNFKKRSHKEKEEVKKQTKVAMLSSVLDIDSDLQLASKKSNDSGLKLIISKLDKFLSGHGIESIQTDHYDENLHEVISIVEIGEEKIVDVISKGYTLEGKPFRFPKIILGR